MALADVGFRCRILERQAIFEEAGAGIQLGPNGVRALRALGVSGGLESLISQPDDIRVYDGKRGSLLTALPLGAIMERRLGAPYWSIHRSDLHQALLARAQESPNIAFEMGFDVDRLEATGDGVRLVGSAGQTATGIAAIGADGVWSKVARYVTDPIKQNATGWRAYRAVMATPDASAHFQPNSVGLWLSSRAHVVHYPVRAATMTAVVVVVADAAAREGWSQSCARDDVLTSVKFLQDGVKATLAQADTWRAWSLYSAPNSACWSNGNVVLIGDAAHPVLPYLAQGGSLALEDALVLAACVKESVGDFPAAFVAFAGKRYARARRVASTAKTNGRIYHMGGLGAVARNLVLRASPAQRLINRYDWVYGWTP